MVIRQYRATKFGNKKVEVDGMKFDSKKEYRRWLELKELETKGMIKNLQRQVEIELIPKQVDEKGKCLERKCSYIADFTYFDIYNDCEVIEDCKGLRTPEYVIKRKMVLWRHGIHIKET